VQVRTDGETDYVFVMNFSGREQRILLDRHEYEDMIASSAAAAGSELLVPANGVRVLKRRSASCT
jgi:beta-galactosidase